MTGASRKVKRVLLKISGEAFRGKERYGIDVDALHHIAKEIAQAFSSHVQMAIVVGGGNIWRGTSDRARGIDRVTADYMGMLATVINALALQDALEKMGVPTRVQSAIEIAKLAEALYPPPGRPAPGKGARRHFRRRDRQPLFFHRHDGRAAGRRDQRAMCS